MFDDERAAKMSQSAIEAPIFSDFKKKISRKSGIFEIHDMNPENKRVNKWFSGPVLSEVSQSGKKKMGYQERLLAEGFVNRFSRDRDEYLTYGNVSVYDRVFEVITSINTSQFKVFRLFGVFGYLQSLVILFYMY